MKTDRIRTLMEAYCKLCVASQTCWEACSLLDHLTRHDDVWAEYSKAEVNLGNAKGFVMDELEKAGHPILRAHITGWQEYMPSEEGGAASYRELDKMLQHYLPYDFEGDSESDSFHGQCTSRVVNGVREFLESHRLKVTVTVEYAKPLGIFNWDEAARWLKNNAVFTKLMKIGERV